MVAQWSRFPAPGRVGPAYVPSSGGGDGPLEQGS